MKTMGRDGVFPCPLPMNDVRCVPMGMSRMVMVGMSLLMVMAGMPGRHVALMGRPFISGLQSRDLGHGDVMPAASDETHGRVLARELTETSW